MSKTVFSLERIDDHLLWLESYIHDRRKFTVPCPETSLELRFLDTIHTMLVDYEDYVKISSKGSK